MPDRSVVQLHFRHLQLFRCPGCGALWMEPAILMGHREREYRLFRCVSYEQYEERVHSERRIDAEEVERVKAEYTGRGLDWRTGKPLPKESGIQTNWDR